MWKKINNRCKEFFQSIASGVGKYWAAILAILVIASLMLLIGAFILHFTFRMGWANWTGFGPYVDTNGKLQPGKTLWDWLQLLIVPIVLALAAFLINLSCYQRKLRLVARTNRPTFSSNPCGVTE